MDEHDESKKASFREMLIGIADGVTCILLNKFVDFTVIMCAIWLANKLGLLH